jgi:hypothetical protein
MSGIYIKHQVERIYMDLRVLTRKSHPVSSPFSWPVIMDLSSVPHNIEVTFGPVMGIRRIGCAFSELDIYVMLLITYKTQFF